MRRREFIAVFGGAAAWPLAGYAQQTERMRRVGVLMHFSASDPRSQVWVTTLRQALAHLGWDQDKNIQFDYRFAAGDLKLFETYAAELVRLSPDVILAITSPAVFAVREQTHAVPIVFVNCPDPVGLGIVQSLAHPGGNITGFASYDAAIIGKWLQLLKEIAPNVARVAIIFNPDTASPNQSLNRQIDLAARSIEITVTLAPVRDDASIEEAVDAEGREQGGGLVVLPDSFNVTHRDVIVAAAARNRLPLISLDLFPRAGGLMSYWFGSVELYREAASYIDRILNGVNPADLPVQYPTKYSLIINLKTAKALGLTVPPSMLDLADEVIE